MLEAMKRYRIGNRAFWYKPEDAPEGAECLDAPKPKPKAKKKAVKAENKAVEPENK